MAPMATCAAFWPMSTLFKLHGSANWSNSNSPCTPCSTAYSSFQASTSLQPPRRCTPFLLLFMLLLQGSCRPRAPAARPPVSSTAFACLGLGGVLRYKPFTGLLSVLSQYSTAPVHPLVQPDHLRQLQPGSDTFRQPLDSQYKLIPALYRLFPVVLPPVQYYPSSPEPCLVPVTYTIPVPDVRDIVLLLVQYISTWMLILTSRLPPDSRWSPATL